MTTYTVAFDRISRNRNPEPFDVEADPGDADLADKLAEAISEKVSPQVLSSQVDVVVDLAVPWGGEIIVGGFRPAGSFTITEQGADA